MDKEPKINYVDQIPDLISFDDYEIAQSNKLFRFRLSFSEDGVEIIGDSPYIQTLEDLIKSLNPDEIEMMLCG